MRKVIVFLFILSIVFSSSVVFGEYYGDNVDEMISVDPEKMDTIVLFIKEADYKVSPEGALIEINGETNLPDETELWVFIKRKDKFITGTSVNVASGSFSCVLGPFTEKFYLGIYGIEVSFIPRRQDSKILAQLKQEWSNKEINVAKELKIGEKEEIILEQKEIVKEIRDSIERVEVLYEELQKSLKAYQDKKINKFEWNTWADKWNKALDIEKNLNADRNKGIIIALFPKVEDEFGGAISQLWLLEKICEKQIQGKKTGVFDPKMIDSKIKGSLSGFKYLVYVDFISDKDNDGNNVKDSEWIDF